MINSKGSHRRFTRLEQFQDQINYIEEMLLMMDINTAWWWQTPLPKFGNREPTYVNLEALAEYVEDLLIDHAFASAGYTIDQHGDLEKL